MIALISVYDTDTNVYTRNVRHLYNILLERTPEESISHKTMPTYKNHETFIKQRPYKEWYLIHNGPRIKGSIYISKQDEIGLFIFKEFRYQGIGGKALLALLDEHPETIFKANINPSNYKSINFFKKFGFLWSSAFDDIDVDGIRYNNETAQVTYTRPINVSLDVS